MIRLNLGCGAHIVEGWVNIDRSLGNRHFPCHPDLVADIRSLPYDDASVDAVYCGHVLEHLSLADALVALKEIDRVLKSTGRFAIVGPDYDRAVAGWPEMCESIWPGTFGEWSDWEGAGHQWCATATNSLALIAEVFPDAVEVPIAELDPFWPAVSFLGWQFAVVAK